MLGPAFGEGHRKVRGMPGAKPCEELGKHRNEANLTCTSWDWTKRDLIVICNVRLDGYASPSIFVVTSVTDK